jgi:hypothetical protein
VPLALATSPSIFTSCSRTSVLSRTTETTQARGQIAMSNKRVINFSLISLNSLNSLVISQAGR